jgi:hypothetical protein
MIETHEHAFEREASPCPSTGEHNFRMGRLGAGRRPSTAHRMRSIGVVVGLVVTLLGCGEKICDEAVDKLEACDIPGQIAEQGYARLPVAITREDCSGTNECFAKCVAPATCDELGYTFVYGGGDPNQPPATGEVQACIMACVE